MQGIDYYKILELPPSATLKEIKSAYRRLAHQFHPDKNGNDPNAAARFEIIKEAYEILSNPTKKEYYLQQRWYEQVMNKKQTEVVITPVSVLKRLLDLDKYVTKLDVHRMDKAGLYDYISYVLSDATIGKLNAFGETGTNTLIIETVLRSSRALPLSMAVPLSERLLKIRSDQTGSEQIKGYIRHTRKADKWNKYKVWVVSLIVLIICLLIYAISS